MVKVSIVKCSSYSEEEVQKAVKQAFDALGGFENFVKPKQKVLLKVNLLAAHKPEEAVTTHPEIVKAVALLCKKQGAKVFVGDSPTGDFGNSAKTAGFEKVCAQVDARLVELSNPVERKTQKRLAAGSLFISKKLEDFDLIINLPKLKTHVFTGFTGAVKNLYGCVPGRVKQEYHLRFSSTEQFCKMLLDLQGIVKPRLSLMDAVVGMQGNGPSAGEPVEIGFLLVSESTIALDYAALKLVGLNPESIPTARLAQELELIDYSKVSIIPEGFAFPAIQGFKPASGTVFGRMRFLLNLSKPLFDQKPFLLPEKCISCGKCFSICPAKAIDFKTKKPKFDYKKCIRCFCCQEICLERAIEIKSAFGRKVLKKLKIL